MKIIIWDLPEREIAYLKRNCEKEFADGRIRIMTPEYAAELYKELNQKEQCVKGEPCTKEEQYAKEEQHAKEEQCAKGREQKQIPQAGNIVLISGNRAILADGVKAGMVTVAYQPPENSSLSEGVSEEQQVLPEKVWEADREEEQGYAQADILVEGFEEVDYDFLEQIYQRHHGIPWTILETERLIVRELALSDIDALFELYSYEGMTDYMEGLYSYEEEYEYQKAYISNMYRFFGYGMWLVFEKETGKLVGRAGIEHREELDGEPEHGYAIGTPWQGKGYATEVCRAILTYAWEELGFDEICSLVLPENEVSVHLLEKLGFSEAGEVVLDEMVYKKYVICDNYM